MVGFEERKGDSGQFWGCPSRNAFWKTAESGRRPLDETPLPDRWWIRKIQRVKRRKFRWLWGRLSVFPVGGPNRALLAVFGPQGVQGRFKNTNLAATVKPQMKMGPTKVDYWSAMWDGKRGRIRYASKNRTHGQVVWKFHYFQQKVWDKEGEIILILIWFVYDSIFWGGRQFIFTWDEYILAQYQLESHLFYY